MKRLKDLLRRKYEDSVQGFEALVRDAGGDVYYFEYDHIIRQFVQTEDGYYVRPIDSRNNAFIVVRNDERKEDRSGDLFIDEFRSFINKNTV